MKVVEGISREGGALALGGVPLDRVLAALRRVEPGREGLFRQLGWAANQLNRGYYLWRAAGLVSLVFPDGATQVFEADGGTTYVESGRPTRGEWYVADDGRFGSFWPPNYRASYDLRWTVQDGAIVGLRFTELDRGSRFDGRYRD